MSTIVPPAQAGVQKAPQDWIPAEAGIQEHSQLLDPGFRRGDGFTGGKIQAKGEKSWRLSFF